MAVDSNNLAIVNCRITNDGNNLAIEVKTREIEKVRELLNLHHTSIFLNSLTITSNLIFIYLFIYK